MKEKLILLGLDGGEPAVLERLLPVCPNLRRLRDEGAWGTLQSTVPPLSPPAWATLMTGVNPGKHGVFDFYHMPFRAQRSYVRRLITSAAWRAPALWDRTTAHRRRAGFVNLPMCWPPPAIDGVFVCGLGTPADGSPFTHPRELGDRLSDALLEPGDGTTMADPQAFLERCRRSGASMLEVAERLWREQPFDLFCAALTLPDRFQHLFWREIEAGEPRVIEVFHGWFAAFDAFLGRLLDAAADAGSTVLVFSDHGFGPVDRYFHPNRWLLRRGWLAVRDPSHLGGPDGLLTAIDWDRTRAWATSEYGDIRLNLRGREPLGMVEPDAAAHLRARLADELLALRDADGVPVVEQVIDGAAVFHGPYAEEGADLIVRLRGERTLCAIDGRGRDLLRAEDPVLVPADRPEHYRGAHRMRGLLAGWGPAIRRPAPVLAADASDLCPTVLHLLDLPLDRTLDGRVLHELLAPAVAARPPVYEDGIGIATGAARAAYDDAEEAQIEAQLRELGYVE